MGPKDKGKTDKQEASYGRMDTETHHKIVPNRAEKISKSTGYPFLFLVSRY